MLLISSGHNIKSPGARIDSFNEHAEAVLWSGLVLDELSYLDIDAEYVPSASLQEKVRFINNRHTLLAIEIHFNSALNSKGRHIGQGSESLYYPGSEKGKILATCIQKYLSPLFLPDRGIKEGWYRSDKPGHIDYAGDIDGDEKPDYFLKYTNCTSVIIEPEFIHHYKTIRDLRSEGSKLIVQGLIEAIEKFKNIENDSNKKDI